MKSVVKILVAAAIVAVLALGACCYIRFWFPYAEGTDTGELNFFTRQGLIFKTYEGKVIQSGFKSRAANANGVQSNEFVFSVEDAAIADSLMHSTGKQVELHYKRYFAPLPWRGESCFVVDSIWSVN